MARSAEELAYRLSELLGASWGGMASDGAIRIKVKPGDLEAVRGLGITEAELRRHEFLAYKEDGPWWQFERICQAAVAFEQEQAPAQSR